MFKFRPRRLCKVQGCWNKTLRGCAEDHGEPWPVCQEHRMALREINGNAEEIYCNSHADMILSDPMHYGRWEVTEDGWEV